MKTRTKKMQAQLTPMKAIKLLKEGNKRFVNNLKAHRNILEQVNETSNGQFPMAAILSCIDSRTSAELIFDQGLGDIFSIRIAGNIVNEDILGSMEFACKVAGAKVIVVLGHSKCGAIMGACDNVKMGNLTALLEKIKPAVDSDETVSENRNSKNPIFVERVAYRNVWMTMNLIIQNSPILCEMIKTDTLAIIGGMYDIDTGIVKFDDLGIITEHKFHTLGEDIISL